MHALFIFDFLNSAWLHFQLASISPMKFPEHHACIYHLWATIHTCDRFTHFPQLSFIALLIINLVNSFSSILFWNCVKRGGWYIKLCKKNYISWLLIFFSSYDFPYLFIFRYFNTTILKKERLTKNLEEAFNY